MRRYTLMQPYSGIASHVSLREGSFTPVGVERHKSTNLPIIKCYIAFKITLENSLRNKIGRKSTLKCQN